MCKVRKCLIDNFIQAKQIEKKKTCETGLLFVYAQNELSHFIFLILIMESKDFSNHNIEFLRTFCPGDSES